MRSPLCRRGQAGERTCSGQRWVQTQHSSSQALSFGLCSRRRHSKENLVNSPLELCSYTAQLTSQAAVWVRDHLL